MPAMAAKTYEPGETCVVALDAGFWHATMRALESGQKVRGFTRLDANTLALVLNDGTVVCTIPRPDEPTRN
jgi:hypothetical protein